MFTMLLITIQSHHYINSTMQTITTTKTNSKKYKKNKITPPHTHTRTLHVCNVDKRKTIVPGLECYAVFLQPGYCDSDRWQQLGSGKCRYL